MPGQNIMGQQGMPVMGQHSGMVPQTGMHVRMPQGQPFMGGPQPQLPGGPRPPGPPGPPAGFFPPGMQGADPRMIQERQLQHRMQMAKLQQQQQQMIDQQGLELVNLAPASFLSQINFNYFFLLHGWHRVSQAELTQLEVYATKELRERKPFETSDYLAAG